MHTIYLSDQEVLAYLSDLGARLMELEAESPNLFIGVGASGAILLKRLAQAVPDIGERKAILVDYNRASDKISYLDAEPSQFIPGARVLLFDATVHSGGTLLRVLRDVEKYRPAAISSYALAVRRGAKVVPNFFGILIGDHDRALFLRPTFPNNRLKPYGVWRKLAAEDLARDMIVTGKGFMDRRTWADFWYEMNTDSNRHTYVYEESQQICAFISFRFQDDRSVIVDEVAVDKRKQKLGVGGQLMRWAEHYARHANCSRMELWAVEDRRYWYEKMGYYHVPGKVLDLEKEKFSLMAKKLLYNLPDYEIQCMGK